MSKFPLDLSKFKRVASDKHTTTLKHEKGHELKLAHGGLSKDIQEKLKKLPMSYAEGTEVPVGEEQSSQDPQPNQPTVVINNTPSPQQGVPVQQVAPPQRAPQNVQELIAANNAAVARNPQSQMPPQGAPPMAQPQGMPQTPAAPGFDPYSAGTAGLQAQLGGIQEEKRGAVGEAQALGQLGTAQAAQESDYQKQLQEKIDSYTQANADLTKERTAMQSDIANGHIDPDRYIKSMSTGGRILQGIGLILGGMGAGMTGGPNFAYQKMQTDIDRDIQAQKDDLGRKQNLLSNNLAQTSNLRQAMDLTRLQMNDMLSSKLKMSADQAQDPMQKAAALKASGALDMQSGQLQHQISVQRAMMGGGGGQSPEDSFQRRMQFLRMNGQDKLAEDIEKKHAAGVPGQASNELTPDNRDELRNKSLFDQKLSDFIDFAKKNNGSLDPQIIAQGKAKSAELNGLYRQATHGGVYKQGENEFINNLIDSNPTKFMNTLRGVVSKAQELRHSNLQSLNNLKSSLGFPAVAGQSDQTQPTIQMSKGVPWQKVRGGWQRVKQ